MAENAAKIATKIADRISMHFIRRFQNGTLAID
jgi:hypothetical protein